MDDKPYWVAFNLVRGIGAVRLQGLIEHFGDAASAWHAEAGDLRVAGLGGKIVDRLLDLRQSLDVDQLWERIAAQGIHIITCDEDFYPRRLKEIEQPPPVLYVRGALLPEDDFAVAIVGTRRITAYGRQVAEELAGFLASNGITVISGVEWTRRPIPPPCVQAAERWQSSVQAWTAFIRRRTVRSRSRQWRVVPY
jgi:DNA processing protein